MLLLICYILGACVAAGARGGVRDEMDGIGDIAAILLWPLMLAWKVLSKLAAACYWLGQKFRR